MRLLVRLAAVLPLLAIALPLPAQVRIEPATPARPAVPTWGWDVLLRAYARQARGQAPAPQQVSPGDARAAMARYNTCFPTQLRDPNTKCAVPPLGRCTVAVEGPDSLALVTPIEGYARQLLIWVPRGRGGGWWQQPYPTAPDTLRARFVDAFCYNAHATDDPRGKVAWFVVEHGGLFMGVSAGDVWEPRPNPSEWERRPNSTFVILPGGELDLAITAKSCDEENRCTQRLAALGLEQERVRDAIDENAGQLREALRKRGYGEEEIDLALEHRVAVGMDTVLVRVALGEPQRIIRSQEAAGASELWYYADSIVMFTDGRVRSVSPNR